MSQAQLAKYTHGQVKRYGENHVDAYRNEYALKQIGCSSEPVYTRQNKNIAKTMI